MNQSDFHAGVTERFGILPNFFQSAKAAPELIQELWGFAKAGYLDNPMPSVFKERLFVWLSRFCPMRYCIVRHVGFLLGRGHGHSSGDAAALPLALTEVVSLLRRPTPWDRDMDTVYAALERLASPLEEWPVSDEQTEDCIFACAAVMFVQPGRSERARQAVLHVLGARRFEFFCGCLAFIRTAHYWTMLHPEIESEDDMLSLMRGHEDLARLLLEDAESDRCEMSERLYEELTGLRELRERRGLEKAKQALEEKDRQKDQFIAVLAHELRNPLAAIRGATDAMKLIGTADERAARLLQRIDRQSIAMARMLDDLLDASRIALGKVAVDLKGIDLAELLQEIVEDHDARVRQAGLEIDLHLETGPCCVMADQVRLRQIIDNLISNATRFTPAGGLMELTLSKEDGAAIVRVRDSGMGFDAEFAGKLFEPFVQQESAPGRPRGGLGLGLAIASRLATLQRGSLSAASDGPSRGATFTLRMPLAPAGRDVSIDAREGEHRQRGTVLIVEDNADVADSLVDLLQLAGFQTLVARDGTEAVRTAFKSVPDVLLCDLGLPGELSGFDVARRCRANPALRSVRLIALSGYSSAADRASALTAGFEIMLTKPLTANVVDVLTVHAAGKHQA